MLKVATSICVFALAAISAGGAEQQIKFSRDIRAMFSDNCFSCHGPDAKQRKGKLRLDTKDGAFEVRDGHAIIKPGDSANSELFKRITASDPDDLMPPPKSGKKLSTAQID